MWWGRLGGVLIGLPAGAFGVAFGFLIGFLVDQVIGDKLERRRVIAFLTNPRETPRLRRSKILRQSRSGLCVVGLGIGVAATDGQATVSQVKRLQRFVAERYVDGRRARAAVRRIIDDAYHVASGLDLEGLAGHLCERTDPAERRQVVALLIDLAGCGIGSVTDAMKQRIRSVAEVLGVEEEELARMFRESHPLDPEACAVLGVSPDAGKTEVKRVYRRLAAQFHPDSATALDQVQRRQAHEAFLRIRRAYERLMAQLDDAEW